VNRHGTCQQGNAAGTRRLIRQPDNGQAAIGLQICNSACPVCADNAGILCQFRQPRHNPAPDISTAFGDNARIFRVGCKPPHRFCARADGYGGVVISLRITAAAVS